MSGRNRLLVFGGIGLALAGLVGFSVASRREKGVEEQLEQAQTAFDVANALATSAEHQVEQARASLKEAQDALSKTVIRAPMDGQVTRVAVEAGEVAVPGTFSKETGLLMTVSDLSVI